MEERMQEDDPAKALASRLSARGWPVHPLTDYVYHEYERREGAWKARSARRQIRHHCRPGGVGAPFYLPPTTLSTLDNRLLAAIKQSKDIAVIEELLESGASASAQEPNKARRSALHIACSKRDVPLVKLLLSYGADLEARDVLRNRPLDIATYANSETYKAIINHLKSLEGANQLSKELSKVSMSDAE